MNQVLVPEEILEAMFGLIPANSFTKRDNVVVPVNAPTYDYGGFEEYNALIKEQGDKIYPLIFQRLTRVSENDKAYEATFDIELILAKNNKRTELRNPTRWRTSYKNILIPLLNDILQCFNESKVIRWDGTYDIERHPNYSVNNDDKTDNAVIDIIDVIVMNATITVLGKPCLNKSIKFKR